MNALTLRRMLCVAGAAVLALASAACGVGIAENVSSVELVGVDDSQPLPTPVTPSDPDVVPEPIATGTQLVTTADLNLREGPSSNDNILVVMPKGSEVTTVDDKGPQNGWYNVAFNGLVGWASASYLKPSVPPVASTPDAPSDATARDAAIARAQKAVGFSYWWGHGRWLEAGPTASTKGSCTGSCPNCSHSGSYGADCSGYVAKVWQVPSSNTDVSKDSHPYATFHFEVDSAQWAGVPRGSILKGDAMVYHSGGAGHIFLYEKSDPWGSFWAYEARGCSYGIVHNLRTAGSQYKAIRRTGY